MARRLCNASAATTRGSLPLFRSLTAAVAVAAPLRCWAPVRPLCSSAAVPSSTASFTERAPATAAAAGVLEAEIVSDSAPAEAELAQAYFPYTSGLPSALPLRDFRLARFGVGGTARPGSTLADSTATVKAYFRLGGNLIELARGSSFAAIDAFKELLQENKIQGDVMIAAAVSTQDLISFLQGEEERWRSALQKRNRGIPASQMQGPKPTFVSELLPEGTAAPTSAETMLPLLPRLLPAYLKHFLELHELDCVDVLLLEPPLVNVAGPERVPDAAFDWLGGVDRSLSTTKGMEAFLAAWFRELERAVQQGSIKSYGLSSARITLGAHAPVESKPVGADANAAALPPRPEQPYGGQFYFPLQCVLQLATDAHKDVAASSSGASSSAAAASTPARGHNLSTVKFPLSLFSAHRMLYSSPSEGSPSFFDVCQSAGLLTLGDLPLEDVEPRYVEWVRFAEVEGDAPATLDAKVLLRQYRDAMQKLSNLEYVFRLLVEDAALDAETKAALPPRVPHFSWAGLIQAHQNDAYNPVTWETLWHKRIRPSLAYSLPHVRNLIGHPKLQDWASRYGQAAPEAAKRFGHAVEHTTHLLNEKLNVVFERALPRLHQFPSLEEKALLVLLSTPVGSILTDQTGAFDRLARSVLRIQEKKKQEERKQQQTGAMATEADAVPTVDTLLREHLLNPTELRAVLDALQSDVAALLPARVMNDEMRKKKPTTLA